MLARIFAHTSWALPPAVLTTALYLFSPPGDAPHDLAHARDCHSCVVSRQQDEARPDRAAIEDNAP